MPKTAKQLTDLEVKQLQSPGLHSVGGVKGLRKQVGKSTGSSWILRVKIAGKTREMGLGPYPAVSLASARDSARQVHELIRQGHDPIAQKHQAAKQLTQERKFTKTFDEVTDLYIASVEQQWSNPKSRGQWLSSLRTYASPQIGKMSCRDIATEHIVGVLDKIWLTKTETATRVRGRIEKILAYATTRGFRDGDNPARYKGHLDTILPSPAKLQAKVHHPSLAYADLPYFMKILRSVDSVAARCLEFMILSASRQGEVRGMTWSELDLDNKLWVIPATRMKAKKEHTVPLTTRCHEILRNVTKRYDSPYVFAALRGGKLSDATVGKLVRTLHANEIANGREGFIDRHQGNLPAVPHGFRSTFRDWAAETTSYPREVIEHCLAHQLKDRSEAAYQRGTILPKRSKLMAQYNEFIFNEQTANTETVTPIRHANL